MINKSKEIQNQWNNNKKCKNKNNLIWICPYN